MKPALIKANHLYSSYLLFIASRYLIAFASDCASSLPGRVAQSVTCLSADTCLTAEPGVTNSIPPRSHTSVMIDHEIMSTVNLIPYAVSRPCGDLRQVWYLLYRFLIFAFFLTLLSVTSESMRIINCLTS